MNQAETKNILGPARSSTIRRTAVPQHRPRRLAVNPRERFQCQAPYPLLSFPPPSPSSIAPWRPTHLQQSELQVLKL